jgi:predicted GNAT family N-acyltransferase
LRKQIVIRSPATDKEWQAYYQLRWEVLRKPWRQPPGSERDALEQDSYHLLADDNEGGVVAVGRLNKTDAVTAKIRYMAVANSYQRQGIGSLLLAALERQAQKWKVSTIELDARDSHRAFYEKHGYLAAGAGPTLFNEITHTKMQKELPRV